MHSSTSSSDRRLPHAAWVPIFAGAVFVAAGFVGAMELRLAARGFSPSFGDTVAQWVTQRRLASALGARALILVGSSRSQVDTDLAVLREETGLDPVQLAIDGSSAIPVLAGLAGDPGIKGTIIVDFAPEDVVRWDQPDEARRVEAQYERNAGRNAVAASIEASLSSWITGHLRSYADGSTPWMSLTHRILETSSTPQYLVTLPDRSRMADYRRVQMPEFYYSRVLRELEYQYNAPQREAIDAASVNALPARIAAIRSNDGDAREFRRHLADLQDLIARIQARGGRVFLVAYPVSGWIREIHDRLHPRAQFWDVMAAAVSATAVDSVDDPALSLYVCPDGSHLDYTDRAPFTRALVNALHLEKGTR